MLPVEVTNQIHDINNSRPDRQQLPTITHAGAPPVPIGSRGDPYKPPPGDTFTKKLPIEIRKQILTAWLPAKDVAVKPLCSSDPPLSKDAKRKAKRNKTSDMMTVCKKIKDEMVTCCYEERTFAIHVHEGLNTGGVEAFDAGRQPLQYHSNSHVDDRFPRFGDEDEFGFKKLKKIEITFFPTAEDTHFTTINTYYMCKALAGLLERSGGKEDRIVSIMFKFAKGQSTTDNSDRRSIIARETRWWDSDNDKPRSTALGHMSDIELVLRPFSIFDNIHNVDVELPPGADSHPDTMQFVLTLINRMTGSTLLGDSSDTFGIHDHAEAYMECKREQLQTEIFEQKHGNKANRVPDISEKEFTEDDGLEDDNSLEDDEELPSRPARKVRGTSENRWPMPQLGNSLHGDSDEEGLMMSAYSGWDSWKPRTATTRLPIKRKRRVVSEGGRHLGSSTGSTTLRDAGRLPLFGFGMNEITSLPALDGSASEGNAWQSIPPSYFMGAVASASTTPNAATNRPRKLRGERPAQSRQPPSAGMSVERAQGVATTMDEQLAAMNQFRKDTGVGTELARGWLKSAGWSLTEALARHKAEQALSSNLSTHSRGSTSSVEGAPSRYCDDAQAEQASSEDTVMADAASAMPEDAVLHQPRPGSSSSQEAASAAGPSQAVRTVEAADGKDSMEGIESVGGALDEGSTPNMAL